MAPGVLLLIQLDVGRRHGKLPAKRLHRVTEHPNLPPEVLHRVGKPLRPIRILTIQEIALSRRSERPLLYLQDERDHPARQIARLLRERSEAGVSSGKDDGAARFDLVGYPAGELEEEIALLASAGIGLNVRLLPDIDLGDCERYLDAQLQVANRKRFLRRFIDELFVRLPIPLVELDTPLGFAATRAWCQAIAGELGVADRLETAWEGYAERWEPRWQQLREEARGYRVGFVVSGFALDDALAGAAFQDQPLLAAVGEMGFGVDLLLHAADPPAAEILPGVRFDRFDEPAGLRAALRRSEARVFSSDFSYDWRLTTMGKTSFSFHELRCGVPGAVANLRRLLALCRCPFYREHGAALDRDARWAAVERGEEV